MIHQRGAVKGGEFSAASASWSPEPSYMVVGLTRCFQIGRNLQRDPNQNLNHDIGTK